MVYLTNEMNVRMSIWKQLESLEAFGTADIKRQYDISFI